MLDTATATTKGASRRRPRPRPARPPPRPGDHGGITDCTVIPEETGGPFPGDGSNGPDVLTENGVVRKDITVELRRQERHRRRRAVHDPVHGRRRRQRLQAADRRRGLRLALRPRGQLLDVPERERPELPARRAGGRRQRRASPSPASSPRATRVAGRTCTSRCTRASTRDERGATSWSRRSSRSRRTCAKRSTRRAGTSRASATCRGVPRVRHGLLRRGATQTPSMTGNASEWVHVVPRGRGVRSGLTDPRRGPSE